MAGIVALSWLQTPAEKTSLMKRHSDMGKTLMHLTVFADQLQLICSIWRLIGTTMVWVCIPITLNHKLGINEYYPSNFPARPKTRLLGQLHSPQTANMKHFRTVKSAYIKNKGGFGDNRFWNWGRHLLKKENYPHWTTENNKRISLQNRQIRSRWRAFKSYSLL